MSEESVANIVVVIMLIIAAGLFVIPLVKILRANKPNELHVITLVLCWVMAYAIAGFATLIARNTP